MRFGIRVFKRLLRTAERTGAGASMISQINEEALNAGLPWRQYFVDQLGREPTPEETPLELPWRE